LDVRNDGIHNADDFIGTLCCGKDLDRDTGFHGVYLQIKIAFAGQSSEGNWKYNVGKKDMMRPDNALFMLPTLA
jgi:hypothetical protein